MTLVEGQTYLPTQRTVYELALPGTEMTPVMVLIICALLVPEDLVVAVHSDVPDRESQIEFHQ